jgi:hypothetical protein
MVARSSPQRLSHAPRSVLGQLLRAYGEALFGRREVWHEGDAEQTVTQALVV